MTVCLVLAVPQTGLAAEEPETVSVPVQGEVETGTSGNENQDTTAPYHHYDCVGPASSSLPDGGLSKVALDGPHEPNPHTANVDGFTFNPFQKIRVTISALNPTLPGLCPASPDAPALGDGFSGKYHVRVVCAQGTDNPGTVPLDLVVRFNAGIPRSTDEDRSGHCQGESLDQYAMDVTVGIKRAEVGYGSPWDSRWVRYGTGGIGLWVEEVPIWR